MKYFIFVTILLNTLTLSAQKSTPAQGTYSMVLSRTSTMEQTEQQCIEQARLKAIGDSFGYTVSEVTLGNTTEQNGKLDDRFSVLTRTSVQGEWLSDTTTPELTWTWDGKELQVTAKVNGKIREFSKNGKVQISFFACSPNDVTTAKDHFKNNDILNCSFTASSKGYLTVYYLDHTTNEAIRLMPSSAYSNMDGVEVEADKTYILFSKNHVRQFENYNGSNDLVVGLPDGKSQVIDNIAAIYSSEPIAKPMLNFSSLSISEFETWRTNSKASNPKVCSQEITISIGK